MPEPHTSMIPVEEAVEMILDNISPIDSEEVAIVEGLGRVVADDMTTDIDLAPFANTAMDGFAVRAEDLATATADAPVELDIIAHLGAGFTFDGTLDPGKAIRIMTGAPMPAGADSVVPVELSTWTGEGSVGEKVVFTEPIAAGRNVRPSGEEARMGDVVVPAGQVLSPAAVGLLASAGHATVPVYRRPRVGVISLGTELVDVTVKPAPGQIRNSNSYSLAADVAAAGGIPRIYPIAIDDPDIIASTIETAVAENDFVISSGGASAGDYDYAHTVAKRLGTVFFTTVAMRPGKSQTFAILGTTPYIGLAGNPTAAEMGFEFLVRPALRKMQGHTVLERPSTEARLLNDIKKKDSRRHYLRGRIDRDPDGGFVADTLGNQSSALLGPMALCNCLLVIPEECRGLKAGDTVECVRIDMVEGTVD